MEKLVSGGLGDASGVPALREFIRPFTRPREQVATSLSLDQRVGMVDGDDVAPWACWFRCFQMVGV